MTRSEAARILNVRESASEKEASDAFRKLAKKHHPDVGGDVKNFQKIQEAYERMKVKSNYGSTAQQYSDFLNNLKAQMEKMEMEYMAHIAINKAELVYACIYGLFLILFVFVTTTLISGICMLFILILTYFKRNWIIRKLAEEYLKKKLKENRK